MWRRSLVLILILAGMLVLPAGVSLIEFTGPGGQKIFVSPDAVTSIREPRGVDVGHFAKGTRCLLYVVNGHFITVTQDCDTVRKRLQASPVFYP